MFPWLQPTTEQFVHLIASDKLAHAILINGVSGLGKTELAHWLAASLLCTAEQKPCDSCKSCSLRRAKNHPDLLILDSSAASIGVDAIRGAGNFLHGSAQQQRNKVVVITEAEKLTEAAANALLKTLEEPPAHSFLVLTSAAASLLPATVLSRCQQWTVAAQFSTSTQQWLAQQSAVPVPDYLLSYCAGAPLKALEMLESGAADALDAGLQNLNSYMRDEISLTECVKSLGIIAELTPLLAWYLQQYLLPALDNQIDTKQLALHQLFARWCRDEKQILGQNKPLALTAFLSSLKRLSR